MFVFIFTLGWVLPRDGIYHHYMVDSVQLCIWHCILNLILKVQTP